MPPADGQSALAEDKDDAEMGKHHLRHHQDRCREHLQALEIAVDLRQAATASQLCDALAAQRRRPIHVEAFPLPPSVHGVCVRTETSDYIFFAADAAPPMQEHIILHEVAHVLLGIPEMMDLHLLEGWLASRQADGRRTALPPALLGAALKRTCYDDECEYLAELLATQIEQRWRTLRRLETGLLPQMSATPDLRWLSEQAGDVD